jgi:hypothetical protein
MPTQRLKQAINSKSLHRSYPFVEFLDEQLLGKLTVQAEERVELINQMFLKNHESNRFVSSQPTTICIASEAFNFAFLGSVTEDPMFFGKEQLGYDFYTEKNNVGSKHHTDHVEELKTVFTVMNGKEVAGFFDFDLSLCCEKGLATMTVHLNQIFVRPEYRGTTYWLDLTIAVHSYVGEILHEIGSNLPKPHYFDVYVTSQFASKSGEKIANFILSELRYVFETFPQITAQRPALIGDVIADMGY